MIKFPILKNSRLGENHFFNGRLGLPGKTHKQTKKRSIFLFNPGWFIVALVFHVYLMVGLVKSLPGLWMVGLDLQGYPPRNSPVRPCQQGFPKGNFQLVFQPSIFRCKNVSFRECMPYKSGSLQSNSSYLSNIAIFHLANGPWKKKVWTLFSLLNICNPKKLKFSHWPWLWGKE